MSNIKHDNGEDLADSMAGYSTAFGRWLEDDHWVKVGGRRDRP